MNARPPFHATFALLLILGVALAGCNNPLKDDKPAHYTDLGYTGADPTGRDRSKWPDLHGAKVTVLDHGAFAAFGQAKAAFEALTNGTVVQTSAADTGTALQQLLDGKKKPVADVIYGIDNAYYYRAVHGGVLTPYEPLLADRIAPEHRFAHSEGMAWYGTPVDFGYVGLNVDPDANFTIHDLGDVRTHADEFVTQDPALSSPGLGFLLATIATYGEGGIYSWQQYWRELFNRGVLVTDDWSTAYANHFTAGYGSHDVGGDGESDRMIVTSYTTSPAYEMFWGRPADRAALNVLAPEATFKQVQTMAIIKGTSNRVAAEAWIEFTLTDAFQELAAPSNAIYPIISNPSSMVDASNTFMGLDPTPGTFVPAQLDAQTIGANLERWLCEWTAIREKDNEGLALCR